MLFLCKHDWEMLSETTSKCILDILREDGSNPYVPHYCASAVTAKKLVQIAACCNCGKIKRFVTKIPG